MEQKFCQSCGMPLTEHVLGTEADGSKSEEYCVYCYKDGAFLQDCTMDEMIEHCAQFVGQVNEASGMQLSREEYIGQMKAYFPRLKRWRLSLSVVERQKMDESDLRTDFLDFCLDRMASLDEPPAVQALCMKLAFRMCQFYPELADEFKRTVEAMEIDFFTPAVKSVRRRILNGKMK